MDLNLSANRQIQKFMIGEISEKIIMVLFSDKCSSSGVARVGGGG